MMPRRPAATPTALGLAGRLSRKLLRWRPTVASSEGAWKQRPLVCPPAFPCGRWIRSSTNKEDIQCVCEGVVKLWGLTTTSSSTYMTNAPTYDSPTRAQTRAHAARSRMFGLTFQLVLSADRREVTRPRSAR